jgi:hypothetical protein
VTVSSRGAGRHTCCAIAEVARHKPIRPTRQRAEKGAVLRIMGRGKLSIESRLRQRKCHSVGV